MMTEPGKTVKIPPDHHGPFPTTNALRIMELEGLPISETNE